MKTADEKIYWGKEPLQENFLPESDPEFTNSLSQFLNTYNFIATEDEKKDWFLKYVANHTDVPTQKFTGVSAKSFSTAGACARLFLRGLDYSTYLNEKLSGFVESLQQQPSSSKENSEVSQEKKIDIRLSFLIESLTSMIDDFIVSGYKTTAEFDMFQWLTLHNPSPTQHLRIKKRFAKLLNELLLIGSDEQVTEGYSHLKNLHRKRFIELLTQITETKKFRKPRTATKKRKTKTKSPEKVAEKVKIASEDEETGVSSTIAPAKIVGASTVWIWNKKYRVLACYNAANGKELTIKGSTIVNFDENTSIGKRIRKPEGIVPKIAGMGKVELKKVLASIKAKPVTLTGRLGKENIILRVI